jgi:nucleoid-associated protein YgaU
VKTKYKTWILMWMSVPLMCGSSLGQTPGKKQPAQGNPPRPLLQQADGHWSRNKPVATTEGYEIHTVKPGDTLWDVSRQYFKDPFLWPQLWETNTSINNPHWIYPGDQILIKKVVVMTPESASPVAQTQAEAPKSEQASTPQPPPAAEAETARAEKPATPPQPSPVATDTELYCSGFFSAEQLQTKALLVGGEESENKSLFSDRDVVYLNQGSVAQIKPGDELQVVRQATEFAKWGTDFAKAKSKTRYGYYYQDIGRLRVLLAQENTATAEVTFACEEILTSDLVIPGEKRVSPLQRTGVSFDKFAPPSGKTSGTVFMSKEFRQLLGDGNVVYIDVGSKQNVQAGDYFRVIRKFHKDNISLSNRLDYKRYRPTFDSVRKVIGEVVVLRVEQNVSTALITYSSQDIMLGDGVELE